MQFSTISHDVDDGVLTVTLDRPDQLNAFTVEMADELEATFVGVNADDDVRAVIVTGAGRAFCAGMDLSVAGNPFGLDESLTPTLADMDDLDDPGLRQVRDTGGRVTLAIYDCRKPVIAAINGAAVGIGATMTLAMDARLMSTKARFGLVFGRLGITPEAASTWFLPRLVGLPTALDLLYSAEILDAARTVEVGLAAALHEPDDLLGRPRHRRPLDPRPLTGRRRDDPPDDVPQCGGPAPGRGPPGRLAVDAVHERRRWRRRGRRVPREARRQLRRQRGDRDAAVLRRVGRQALNSAA